MEKNEDEIESFYRWSCDEELRSLQTSLNHLLSNADGLDADDKNTFESAREVSDSTKGLVEFKYGGVGGNPTNLIKILDLPKLKRFSIYVDNKIEKINSAIQSAFAMKPKIKWRCPACGHFMEAFEKRTPRKLEKVLFKEPTPRHCKKCRKQSVVIEWQRKIKFVRVEEQN